MRADLKGKALFAFKGVRKKEVGTSTYARVVILDDTTELLSAFNVAFERWCEIDIEDIVADVLTSVWPSRVVIFYPDRLAVMQLVYV